jgi:hypothetical protein
VPPVAQQCRLWRNSARIHIWNYSIIAIIFQHEGYATLTKVAIEGTFGVCGASRDGGT